jgi:hypothetical protein
MCEGTIGDRLAWLKADPNTRREKADRILFADGVPTFGDKWAEVHRD